MRLRKRCNDNLEPCCCANVQWHLSAARVSSGNNCVATLCDYWPAVWLAYCLKNANCSPDRQQWLAVWQQPLFLFDGAATIVLEYFSKLKFDERD